MKNKILIICAAFLLVIFLACGTFAWYLYFLNASGNGSIGTSNSLKYGDIVFKDDGNSVYDSDASVVEDENANSVVPYKFQVINSGNKDGDYYLYIEDLPVNAINDGCTNSTLLKREQLKYQLKLNGTIIKEDYLSNIKDNILDNRNITGNATNNYELRIYIHDEALEWTGKHYHYKVVLNKSK